MNYLTHYNNLINRAKPRTLVEGFEKHHIIPRCMGGNDDDTNIANLTPEEHYVAHQLLVKIYPKNSKLIFAASMMIPANPHQPHRKNKLYGWLRQKLAEARKNNTPSQLGTMWINNGIINRKVQNSQPLEFGWVKGRLLTNSFNGFSYINSLPNQNHKPGQQAEASRKSAYKLKNDPEHRKNRLKKLSESSNFKSKNFINPATYHKWISNDAEEKSLYVAKDTLDFYFNKGWYFGRKYKKRN